MFKKTLYHEVTAVFI